MALFLLMAPAATIALLPKTVVDPTAVDIWQGTMSYPCTAECEHAGKWLCHNVPIKISVDGGTGLASVSWVWTVLPTAGGAAVEHCVPKSETGLRVSTGAGHQWFAKADGTSAEFYSLEAKITASGDMLTDGIIYYSKGGEWPGTRAGIFNATKDAAPANVTCVPPPPLPPAPSPTPAYNGPSLWPMPANLSFGASTVALTPHFWFHCEHCDAGSLLPTAFARYTTLLAESSGIGHKSARTAAVKGPSLAMLTVRVDNLEERKSLQLGMDESYSLTILGDNDGPGVGSLHGK